VLEFELASALHCIIHSHWMRLLQNATFRPTVQVGSTHCPLGAFTRSREAWENWLFSQAL
jgi:hypothetical protein